MEIKTIKRYHLTLVRICLPACEEPEPPSQVFVQAPGGTIVDSTCFDTAVDSRRGGNINLSDQSKFQDLS